VAIYSLNRSARSDVLMFQLLLFRIKEREALRSLDRKEQENGGE